MPAFKEGWELPPKTTMLRTMIDQLEKGEVLQCYGSRRATLRREEREMIVGGRATGCAVKDLALRSSSLEVLEWS